MSGYGGDDQIEGGDWQWPDDEEGYEEHQGPEGEEGASGSIEDNPFVGRYVGDPRLREAMRSGEYGRFRRILEYYRSQADEADELEAIDYVYYNPQLFVPPVGKAPKLFTLNGFGTRLVGKKDRDEATGFRIATLYLTLLFLPVFPIRRYLVRSFDEDHYEFYGKLAASPAQNLWRVMLVMGTLAMGLLAMAAIVIASWSYTPDVQIINAFDEPVELVVDGEESFEIPPRSLVAKPVADGTRQFTTRFVDGTEIEELEFEVPRRKDLVVYNIAGAAPAIVESVTYFDMTGPEYLSGAYLEHVEDYEFLAGLRRYVRDDVRYIDVDPPEEIDIHGGGRTVQWALYYERMAYDWAYRYEDTLIDDDALTGFGDEVVEPASQEFTDEEREEIYRYYLSPQASLDQLYMSDNESFRELLIRLIGIQPDEEWHHHWIYDAVYLADDRGDRDGIKNWLDTLDRVGQENPEALQLHLVIIDLNDQYGPLLGREAVEDRYRSHHEEFDTAESAFLLARASDDAEEIIHLLQRVVDEERDRHSQLLAAAYRDMGMMKYGRGDCAASVEYFEASIDIEDEFDTAGLSAHVECLAELGRYDVGRALLVWAHTEIAELEYSHGFHPSEMYGRVVLSDPEAQDDPFKLARLGYQQVPYLDFERDGRVHYANSMGLKIDIDEARRQGADEYGEEALRVNEVLYHRSHDLTQVVSEMLTRLMVVDEDVGLLIAMLADLRGDGRAFETLGMYHFASYGDFEEFRREVREVTNDYRFDAPPPEEWQSGQRAAYYLARAYVAQDDQERREAIEKAQDETSLWGPLDGVAEGLKRAYADPEAQPGAGGGGIRGQGR